MENNSYKHFNLIIIAAICLFLTFYSFPNVRNIKIKKALDIITNYTAGIYFTHNLIGRGYIMYYILNNKIHTFYGCLILYLISYSFCFFLDKMIINKKLKHLIK